MTDTAMAFSSAGFTWAHWCVLVVALLPVVCAGLAKQKGFGKPRRDGGFDNHDPRAWLAKQSGFQARANAAQANSFEALPFFVAAVVVAWQLGASVHWVNGLAVAFVLARIAFIALYLADRPTWRSMAWVAGMAITVALFFVGYR